MYGVQVRWHCIFTQAAVVESTCALYMLIFSADLFAFNLQNISWCEETKAFHVLLVLVRPA